MHHSASGYVACGQRESRFKVAVASGGGLPHCRWGLGRKLPIHLLPFAIKTIRKNQIDYRCERWPRGNRPGVIILKSLFFKCLWPLLWPVARSWPAGCFYTFPENKKGMTENKQQSLCYRWGDDHEPHHHYRRFFGFRLLAELCQRHPGLWQFATPEENRCQHEQPPV
jgi:hypothetical protein